MANFGNLVVRLGLDKRQFDTGIGSVRSTLGTVASSIATVTTRIAAYGAAIATASAAGAALLVRNSFKQIDALGDLSTRLGIATEDLSRFQHVAELSGTDIESLGRSLQFMLRSISKFSGNLKADSPFAMLGLDAAQLQRLGVADQFIAIAKAFERIRNPADRVRIAMEIFGRSGAQMLNLFEGGADSIREMVDEADRLGRTLSSFDVAQVQAADDAIVAMKSSVSGLVNQITVDLSPAIQSFAMIATEAFGSLRPIVQGLIGDTTDLGSKMFQTVEGFKLLSAAHAMIQAKVHPAAREFALGVLRNDIARRHQEFMGKLTTPTPRPAFGADPEDVDVNDRRQVPGVGKGGLMGLGGLGMGLMIPGIADIVRRVAMRPRGEPGGLPEGSLRGSQDALNKIARAQNSVEAKSLNVQQQQLTALNKIEKKLPANKGNEIAIGMFGAQ